MKTWDEMTSDEKIEDLHSNVERIDRRLATISSDLNRILMTFDGRIKELEKNRTNKNPPA
jgi:archaellum component FlaC